MQDGMMEQIRIHKENYNANIQYGENRKWKEKDELKVNQSNAKK